MRALRLFGDRDARLAEMDPPQAPGPGEIQLRMLAVALNHIDVWGWRGMAFAKRNLPMTPAMIEELRQRRQAIFLDDRDETTKGFDPEKP